MSQGFFWVSNCDDAMTESASYTLPLTSLLDAAEPSIFSSMPTVHYNGIYYSNIQDLSKTCDPVRAMTQSYDISHMSSWLHPPSPPGPKFWRHDVLNFVSARLLYVTSSGLKINQMLMPDLVR